MMTIELCCLNLGFWNNFTCRDEIERRTAAGWGIDRVVHVGGDSWVTFYRYKNVEISQQEASGKKVCQGLVENRKR